MTGAIYLSQQWRWEEKGGRNHSFHKANITLFHMIQGRSAVRWGLFASRPGASLFILVRKIKLLLFTVAVGWQLLRAPSRWEEAEEEEEKRKRRKEWMRWRRPGWKRERESEAKLWLLRSMLYHVTALPSSLKGPELRFGLPTRRWISAFVRLFLPPPAPRTRIHTRCDHPSQGVLLFEVGSTQMFL